MMVIVANPERFIGQKVGNGQCVRLCQIACPELTHTSTWRRGEKARDVDPPYGTVIATFDPSGRYGNHTDGRSHAAVYERTDEEGLRVIDQWSGQVCHRRLIRFRGGAGKAVNDGDKFHVVEIA